MLLAGFSFSTEESKVANKVGSKNQFLFGWKSGEKKSSTVPAFLLYVYFILLVCFFHFRKNLVMQLFPVML